MFIKAKWPNIFEIHEKIDDSTSQSPMFLTLKSNDEFEFIFGGAVIGDDFFDIFCLN